MAYYVSWNNKATKDHSAADGNFSFGPVHRADLLDRPARERIAAGRKFSRSDVVELVERAAVAGLRGVEVLDDLSRVVRSEPVTDPALASAIAALDAWRAGGALRREASKGDKRYADADAIRIMDAWWPLLVRAEFRDALGDGLYLSLVDALGINESPSGGQRGDVSTLPGGAAAGGQAHKGSSFQYGWWGYVEKDLRAVLGERVPGWTGQRFCGGGDLAGTGRRTSRSSRSRRAAARTWRTWHWAGRSRRRRRRAMSAMVGVKRATGYGYSLWELEVYPH